MDLEEEDQEDQRVCPCVQHLNVHHIVVGILVVGNIGPPTPIGIANFMAVRQIGLLGAVGAVGVPVRQVHGGVHGLVGVAIPLARDRQRMMVNIGEEIG